MLYLSLTNIHSSLKNALSDCLKDGTELTDGSIFTNNVYDEDSEEPLNAEEHRFSLDCESGTQTHRFYLDPTTARLTFKGPFDLDTGTTPDEVSCVITVTDKYGLSDTAGEYSVPIRDSSTFAKLRNNKVLRNYNYQEIDKSFKKVKVSYSLIAQ